MISYTNQRHEPHGALCGPPVVRQISSGAAVVNLVQYELGYGGVVTHCDDERVVCRTSCLGRYDIVTFEGTTEEMRPLIQAIACWISVRKQAGKAVNSHMAELALNMGLNRPVHLGMLAMLSSGCFSLPVLCLVAGLTPEQAGELKKQAGDYATPQNRFNEFINPVIELMIDTGCSFEEVMAVAA